MKAPNTGDFRAHFCCLGTFVTKLPPSNLAITQECSSIYALREDYTLLIKGTRVSQKWYLLLSINIGAVNGKDIDWDYQISDILVDYRYNSNLESFVL